MKANEIAQVLGLSTALATVRDQDALLALVVEKTKPLVDFEDCGIFALSPDGQRHRDLAAVMPEVSASGWNDYLRAHNAPELAHPGSPLEWMLAELAAHGSPRVFDFQALRVQFPDYPQFEYKGISAYHDCLAAPLQSRGRVFGMFCLNALRRNHFRPVQFALFQAVAEQVAGAVATILANEEIITREQEKNVLLAVSKTIATVRERKELVTTIINKVKPVIPIADTGILILSRTGDAWQDWTNVDNYQGSLAATQLQQLGYNQWQPMDSFMQYALHHSGIMSVAQFRGQYPTHPFGPVMWEAGLREFMFTPLVNGGQKLGALFFDSEREGTYTPGHLDLFKALADLIATAVANILANEEILEREREKALLLSLSKEIAKIHSRQDLLDVVFRTVRPILPFDDVGLFYFCDPDGTPNPAGTCHVHLTDDVGSDLNQQISLTGSALVPAGTEAVRAAATEAPGLVDFRALQQAHPGHPFYPLMNEAGIRQLLAMGIKRGSEVIGMLSFNSCQPHFYTEAHFPLFEDIANQIAVVVANILANEDIVAREREKALLLSISQQLAGIRSQTELRDELLTNLKSVFGYDEAVLSLYTPDLTTVEHLRGNPPGQLLSEHQERLLTTGLPVAGGPHEVFQTYTAPQIVPLASVAARYPGHPGIRVMQRLGLHESVIMPLRNGQQLLGQLEFHARDAGLFASGQLPVFSALADQIAVVVANIRANEKLLEREREKSVLLSISESIATVRGKEDLLRVIITKIKPLLPFYDCGILVVDRQQQHYFDLTVVHPAIDDSAVNHRLHQASLYGAGGLPYAGSAVQWLVQQLEVTHHPIVFDYHADNSRFSDAELLATLKQEGYQEGLAGLLKIGGRAFGCFTLNAVQREQWRPEQYPLFQSITEQLSVAVANILANEDILRREQEKELELAVNNALLASKDRESLCRTLAGQLSRLVPFSFFVLCTWKPAEPTRYQLTLRRQPDGTFTSVRREVLQLAPPELSEPQRDELFAHPGVYAGPDYDALCARYPLYHFVREQFGLRAQLRLSLRSRTGELTSIVVSGPDAQDFQPADYDKLHHLVPQITLALDNLLAFEDLDQRRHEKAAQVAVTNVLTSGLSFNELVPALAGQLDALVRCDLVHLCLLPPRAVPDADVAVVRESGQFRPLTRAEVQPWLPTEALANSFAQLQVLAAAARLYVGDELPTAIDVVPLLRYFYEQQGMRALLLLPLRVGGELVGGLLLGHRFAYGFTDRDRAGLEAVAAQMALALGHRFAFAEIASLQQQLSQENSYLQDEINTAHNFADIIGTSPPLLEVFRQVGQVAGTDTTVCIGGETGTGKELIARALHNLSPRQERLLVKVNCAALPAQLIESELFGHEKGAFTGAHERRLGKFELADGGSIFLDEIGEMPLELQAKLLRVLQEKEIERLGGKGPIQTDVRIIAATNRDLAQEVEAGRFRQDLYFRLMVFPLVLPPLRERKEDLPALANHFLFQFARKLGKPHKGLAPAALRELMAYNWPGNIRELQHVIEQALIVSIKPLLELARPLRPALPAPAETFRLQSLQELERKHIVATLGYTNGRIRGRGGAAELLDIKATTLEARMKKLGIGKSYAVRADVLLN